ncbi:MFS transporter [Knoellia sp. S7-12]|uniref:MFS transporter n=1 Tax=Knoellia sp. S7-12 TaxID=3126698 RepID=UPI003369A44C
MLYYAFPVMLPALTRDTGWSPAAATAVFSAALVVSAVAGIPVGHVIDRVGPRWIMTLGSVAGAGGFAVISTAGNLGVFFVGWTIIGLAMSATFYQPAFAALTRWYGLNRVRALTTLTLAGGLASTVFAPLTATLSDAFGWRRAGLILALTVLVIATPLHAFALKGSWPHEQSAAPKNAGHAGDQVRSAHVVRTRAFLALAAALTLSGFAMYAVVFGLIPLLTHRGATTTQAAWALGLGGLGQTLGRVLYSSLARRTSPRARTASLIFAGAVTTAALAALASPIWLLTATAMVAGSVRGNLTLLQATAVPDRWGTTSYGRITAVLVAPVTIAGALAPWVGTVLAQPLGGYPNLFWLLTGISCVAVVLALAGQEPVTSLRKR